MESNYSTETSDQFCPYCGEPIQLIIEPIEEEQQTYIEDCEVCCRPMVVQLSSNGDVWLRREDD